MKSKSRPPRSSNIAGWRRKFIEHLKHLPCIQKGCFISRILSDDDTLTRAATFVESYIHRRTLPLEAERKARGKNMKQRLRTAIHGIEIGAGLFSESAEPDKSEFLLDMRNELTRRLGRCKEAYDTKRLGVGKDHTDLLYLQRFLEVRLAKSVPIATLASLLEIGYLTDGKEKDVDVESLRRNLTNFKNRNPVLAQLVERDVQKYRRI